MTKLRWSKTAGKGAFHAARTSCTRSRPVAYHGHDFAEIFWIDAGHGMHEINGAEFPLEPGSLVLMRPDDCHGIRSSVSEELLLTNIAFPRETVDFLAARYFPGQAVAFRHQQKYPTVHQIDPSQRHRFNQWADDLAQAPRDRLYAECFLLNVLIELKREQRTSPFDHLPDWLAQACRTIQMPDQFSGGVEQFLRLCGRSREHAARMVRFHFDVTPTEYVNRIRMTYAMRQLEMGDRDILDIALDCGIENLSHFYSLFRARTGTSPRAYRLSHRKTTISTAGSRLAE